MLGDPANLGQVMSSTGLVSGGAAAGDAQGFIEINQRRAAQDTFALDQERVKKLTQVVQFLERQKYNVTDVATQVLADEAQLEEQKIKRGLGTGSK